MQAIKQHNLDWTISAKTSWWNLNLKEWWLYRHLLGRLIRRDFLLNYQQTMLGPAWILLQPILTLFVFVIVFGGILRIETGNTPQVLFFLSGIVLWNFFNESFLAISFVFLHNAEIYTKVYFPRLIIPLAYLISQAIRFVIQFVLLILVWVYFAVMQGASFNITPYLLLVPVVAILIGMLSFSAGIIFSILTGKYRDLGNVVHLGLRLLMFVTPIFYPASYIPDKIRWVADLNPLSSLFEIFRLGILGEGSFTTNGFIYSCVFTFVLFILSAMIFSKQSDKLIDIV